MSTISHIKHVIREVQPRLNDLTQATMDCLEQLRACGIFTEEMEHLADAVTNLEETTTLLEDRLVSFREYEDLNDSGEED